MPQQTFLNLKIKTKNVAFKKKLKFHLKFFLTYKYIEALRLGPIPIIRNCFVQQKHQVVVVGIFRRFIV